MSCAPSASRTSRSPPARSASRPCPPGSDFQLTVNTQGRLLDEQQFGDIIVKQGAQGQVTRVRDVARVELAARDYSIASQLNGKPAAALVIFQLPGSNAIETSDAVRAKLEELKKNFPPGVDYRMIYDTTVFARESISAVVHTLFEAVLLVVLVVIVFLQNWRASIIPLLAVPVSLIGTFAVMQAFGFSLNNLSLFGLVLAIGIVVDDAIVVVENVERNIALGLAPVEATQEGDERSQRPGHRRGAGAVRGVHPDRVRQRHHRAVLPTVRADHRGLDRHQRLQFADAFARAQRASC